MDGVEIEVVMSFCFLGAMIETESGCEKEIGLRRRVTLGRVAMQALEKIWKNKYVSKQTKARIIKAMVFSAVLHGSETWAMESKTDVCEMWIWRKMLRVAWTKRRTNESILQ